MKIRNIKQWTRDNLGAWGAVAMLVLFIILIVCIIFNLLSPIQIFAYSVFALFFGMSVLVLTVLSK